MYKNSDKPIQILDEVGCLGTKEATDAIMEIPQNEVVAIIPQDVPPIVESAPQIMEPTNLDIRNSKKDNQLENVVQPHISPTEEVDQTSKGQEDLPMLNQNSNMNDVVLEEAVNNTLTISEGLIISNSMNDLSLR
ncbi:hypothetical protein ACH5RR_034094 [Cinchona calisaya]|uniref:Uncharacterized protein n=1 Tax=Cinchona calisaya TaxID=153742 RepID=A0ABD2Y9V5_9GENT